MKTTIYSHLDEERKILTFSISEIVFTAVVALLGFTTSQEIVAISGIFSGVFIMRYINAKMKKTGFTKKVFFSLSDLVVRGRVKYYGKYYL